MPYFKSRLTNRPYTALVLLFGAILTHLLIHLLVSATDTDFAWLIAMRMLGVHFAWTFACHARRIIFRFFIFFHKFKVKSFLLLLNSQRASTNQKNRYICREQHKVKLPTHFVICGKWNAPLGYFYGDCADHYAT